MKGNRGLDTVPEIEVRRELHRRGLRFRKHAVPLAGLRCRADVVFPSARVALFIDGCFWHGCPEHGRTPSTNGAYWSEKIARNGARDARNNERLSAAGWTVIRAWEHEPPQEVADRVIAAVRPR
jgi:DNA mismatch endonuclease (patch repair protein)